MSRRGSHGGRSLLVGVIGAVVLLAGAVVAVAFWPWGSGWGGLGWPRTVAGGPSANAGATPSAGPGTSPGPGAGPSGALSYPATGPGTYVSAQGQSAVFGTAGPLRTYRVAVETGTPVPADDFARVVDSTLGDHRSWIAGGDVRLQRVGGEPAGYDFTVYLVTPGTAYKICLAGGYDIFWRGQPYTSCRVGAKVVINIARYLHSVPGYGAPLEAYQQYAINHEVGHALGHGHELCPGQGRLAPVMQQQTFSLQGCRANSWPFVDGRRYVGPAGGPP